MLSIIEEEGEQLGIIIISEKWNTDKEHFLSFHKTSRLDNLSHIISFYHNKKSDTFILSNIITDKTYSLTLDQLYHKHDFFKGLNATD